MGDANEFSNMERMALSRWLVTLIAACCWIGNYEIAAFVANSPAFREVNHDRPNCVWFRSRLHSLPTDASSTTSTAAAQTVLQHLETWPALANDYAESFGLGPAEAAFYGLFGALRQSQIPLGLHGQPFVLSHDDIQAAWPQPTHWPGFFTLQDLERAVSEDFLDAARGSTDNRKGWKVSKQYSSTPEYKATFCRKRIFQVV
jgi:hypothetical protein